MQYATAPVSTLFVKARLRKSPYSNKLVALRITANFYEDFKHNDVLFMREINPNCTALQLQAVFAQLKKEANAANISVNIAPAIAKKFNS